MRTISVLVILAIFAIVLYILNRNEIIDIKKRDFIRYFTCVGIGTHIYWLYLILTGV